ncbi:GPI inositol-deacylase [Armadillidium vulgare]|nr:GPI inositol-deacylase [Armadillidium vulgare]
MPILFRSLCWLTTDHLAIVWCKQLVLAINRALFISVNTSTLQLSSDRNHIIQSFKDHLSQKLNSEIPPKTIEQKIKSHLEKKSDFVELTKLQSLKTFKNTFRSKMFLIPLTFAEKNRILSIVMKDVSPNSFVFSTKIDNGSDIIHVDYETVVQHRLRSIPKRRQEVNIDLKSIQIDNHTHVIAYAEPSNKQATFALDINDKYSHYARIEAPNFMSSFSPIVIMNQTPPNALSINITIENFIEYWQSYTLTLLPIGSCTANDGLPFVSLRSSWLDRWEYVIRRSNDSNEFVLGLDVPSPNPDHGQVQLHVVLDPSCTYSVRFQKSLRGIFDRISLLSVPQLPAFVVSQLLLILASQLKAVNDGSISSLNSQIAQLTPFSVVPLTKIFGMLLEKFPTIETDKSYLEKHRTNIAILPMLLFVSSIPLTIAASVNKSIVKENDDKVGILFFNYSSFFPILFLGIGMSTCSSLGLALALAFYFVKLLKIKCNINEKEVQQTQSLEKNKERTEHSEIEKSTSTESSNTQNSKELKTQALEKNKERTEHSEIEKSTTAESSNTQNSKELETHSTDAKNLKCNSNNLALNWYEIHLTLMTLLVIIFLLSIPSLITWFKSPRFPERLYPDSFLIPFIVMALSFEILWQVQFFKSGRFFKILNYVLKICSVSVIMFGSVHHYRINGIVSVVFAVLALHQAFEIS